MQITGFQQFLEILTVPDNIPIMAMMILVLFFTYVSLKQARRNDQLIEQGIANKSSRRCASRSITSHAFCDYRRDLHRMQRV